MEEEEEVTLRKKRVGGANNVFSFLSSSSSPDLKQIVSSPRVEKEAAAVVKHGESFALFCCC